MIVRKTLEELDPVTEEEMEMLKKAAQMPIVFDEDSPELTEEQLKSFYRANDVKKQDRKQHSASKQVSYS